MFIENPIKTYVIGHGSPFQLNADDSAKIYMQIESPGKDLQINRLPAPKGDFN